MTPIIRRELLEWLRTRKSLTLQLGLALACATLVLVRWPTGGIEALSGTRSLEVLRIFGYGALAGILVLVPPLPATALVREKAQGTLALLLNSPLSGLSIYLGKLFGSLGFTVILLLMTLPAAAACYALGGTSVQGGVALLYIVLGVGAVQLTTLGLFISSRVQAIDGALRFTYGAVLLLAVLPLVPYWLLQGLDANLDVVISWVRCLSPIPAVTSVLGHSEIGGHGFAAGDASVRQYLILAGVMSLLCAVLTVMRLNQRMLDRARPAGLNTGEWQLGARIAWRTFFLLNPWQRRGGIRDWVNPVLSKEFRTRRFGSSHWTLRLVVATAIISLLLSYLAASGALAWGAEAVGGALVVLQVAILMLFAPSLGSGIISAERESGSWQLLRMTPLSPFRILWGKLLSVAWPLFLLLCATVPGYLVMVKVDPEIEARVQEPFERRFHTPAPIFAGVMTEEQVRAISICLCLTTVFAVLLSVAASTIFRTTAGATAASYGFLLAVSLGPILIWLGRGSPFGHRTVEVALTISPVATAMHAAAMPGFTAYELLPINWWILGCVSVLMLFVITLRMWRLCRPQ
jgi:ABC-type transport system involved in multi-copper enzyme maturation permease subunit